MNFSFDSFIDNSFDYDKENKIHACMWLKEKNADISGGKITVQDIDRIRDFPNTEVVTISGLEQDTFEYFISRYGHGLKAIRFFKNKKIEDLSILGTLSDLEYVYLFANQRVTSLWDMSNNLSLSGLCIDDFSRLHSMNKIETAPSLKDFRIGNAVWDKAEIDSFMPMADTKLERLEFSGKKISDNDLSFLESMQNLKIFNFASNLFTTEQIAWISANFPNINGDSIMAKHDYISTDFEGNTASETTIIGKRKPHMLTDGNEDRIRKYVENFERLKKKFKGLTYKEAFPDNI